MNSISVLPRSNPTVHDSQRWSIVARTCGLLVAIGSLAASAEAAGGKYQLTVLQSDGTTAAPNTDPNLVNPWGLAASPTGPWWIADNHSSLSTLVDSTGVSIPTAVSIPGASGGGSPTGIVYNSTQDFTITDGVTTAPATFIFASEDGTITGWNTGVPAPGPSTAAQIAVDNSLTGAIYKGLALVTSQQGSFLYATDFHNAKIDVFDKDFNQISTVGGFVDPLIPAGFAPFGIAFLNNKLYVSYARQDLTATDDVAGKHLGYVDVFATDGNLISRLLKKGSLNAPWGLAIAPATFGKFSNMLLVGNFGDGAINVYDPITGAPKGSLKNTQGKKIKIEGLWALSFGNGGTAGPVDSLFFTAGPADETQGIFGSITSAP